MKKENKLLIIAGLDPTGEAGLLRDFSVAQKMGVQAAGIVTALTCQSNQQFFHLQPVAAQELRNQLTSLGTPCEFNAIKIGMMGNEKLVAVLVKWLKSSKNRPPIVLDPVLQSTSGGTLLTIKGRKILWERLLPLCDLWTPNLPEFYYFKNVIASAAKQSSTRTSTLLKGGHSSSKIIDIFMSAKSRIEFIKKRWKQRVRGTGCALSTLIACHLAQGKSLEGSVKLAEKNFEPLILPKR